MANRAVDTARKQAVVSGASRRGGSGTTDKGSLLKTAVATVGPPITLALLRYAWRHPLLAGAAAVGAFIWKKKGGASGATSSTARRS
jgi:hypothetical protein